MGFGRHLVWGLSVLGGFAGAASAIFTLYNQHRPAQIKIYSDKIGYVAPSKECESQTREVFAIPITIVNFGGKTSVISSITLSIKELSSSRPDTFEIYFTGRWRDGSGSCFNRDSIGSFIPIAIEGGHAQGLEAVFTEDKLKRTIMPDKKYWFTITAYEYDADIFSLAPGNARLERKSDPFCVRARGLDPNEQRIVGLERVHDNDCS